MLITNPYDTSYGSLINVNNLKVELDKYFITHPIDYLNYEFTNPPNTNLAFIIGADDDEKNISMFKHPLLYRNMRNQKVIAVDLRPYVKNCKGQRIYNIQDIVRDKAAVNFLTKTAIILGEFEEDEVGKYRKYYSNINLAFGVLMSYLVGIIVVLNPQEKLNVELASMYYSGLMLAKGTVQEHKESIIARICNTKLVTPFTKNGIKDLLEDKDLTEHGIGGLVELIHAVLPPDKAELVQEKILLNVLNNLWFGPGATEAMLMAMECMPYFIGIITSGVTELQYKKCRISTILEKYKKLLNIQELDKAINLDIEGKKTTTASIDTNF